jgi:hypothetical protein
VIIKDSNAPEDPKIVHNDQSPPFFMIKAQQDNSTINANIPPALQSSIVEAVSQATQNIPDSAKFGLDGKAFNMTLVVNNPSLAMPSNNTVTLPALPAGAEGISAEYMAAVAISLQKTKELEEAKHQAAIQKTLTMALEQKAKDRAIKEEQDRLAAIELAKQQEELKKKAEIDQKAHDEFIRRHIELAKKKKEEDDAKAKEDAEKFALVVKEMEEKKKADEAKKAIDDAKKAEEEKQAMRKTSELYKKAVQKSIDLANGKVTFTDMAGAINDSIIPEKNATASAK